MYTVIKKLNGKYLCIGGLQDGSERWEEDSLEAAVKSMKRFAEVMNGARGEHKLKRKHITFLQERNVTTTACVPWDGK